MPSPIHPLVGCSCWTIIMPSANPLFIRRWPFSSTTYPQTSMCCCSREPSRIFRFCAGAPEESSPNCTQQICVSPWMRRRLFSASRSQSPFQKQRLPGLIALWAAGLRLLSLALPAWHTGTAIEQALLELGKRADFSNQHADGANAPQRSLLAYFVTEILDTQSEPMQHFLLHTSMLSRLCAPLCNAVTGGKDSAEQLEAVARAGLFLEAMEGPGGWYRYHALFAEAMRREASRRLGEEVLRAYALRASSWYEPDESLPEAIEAAWLAQGMERVARLIEQVHEQNFGSPQTMLRWLEQLPEAVLRVHPLLCFLFATELRFPVKLWFAQEAALAAEAASLPSAERARVETLLSMAEEGWRSRGEFSWIGGIWAHRALS